jgi:hypothetical protein
MLKKTYRLFCPKKHYMIHFFLIAIHDWWFVIVCCLIEDRSKRDCHAKHSQNCHDYHRSLDKFHRQLRQRNIPRCSLQEQSQSAWRCLYKSRNDQGIFTLTGFDHATFNSLCEMFTPVFELYTPFVSSGVLCFERTKEQNRGRPWMIWPEDGLGLVLAWTRTRGLLMVLQLIFGMMYTNLDDYLLFTKRIIVMVLQDHPMAKVQIPSTKKIEEYVEMVNRRHPYLLDIWCTMDGLKLMLE